MLTGTLEPTNEPYAVAKIAGIKLCESYNRQEASGCFRLHNLGWQAKIGLEQGLNQAYDWYLQDLGLKG